MKLSSSGEGPLVIKLAGLAGGVRLYLEEMDAAVAAGFRVAALDTSGDRRDDPAPVALSWDLLAGEVVRALDLLDTPRGILWGTSYGCTVALATAARHPEKVSGLLLCHPPDPRRQRRVYRSIMRWALRQPDPDLSTAILFRLVFALLAGWEFLAPMAAVRFPALAREGLSARTPSSTIRQKLSLLWEDDPGQPPAGARIPVSIVAGDWDTIAPPSGARRLASRLPDARLRMLGFSGHLGAYSRPAAYARIALEELRRVTGVGAGGRFPSPPSAREVAHRPRRSSSSS